MADDELLDLRIGSDPINDISRLKAQLNKVRARVVEDHSYFKEKKAYRLKGTVHAVYYINYIAVDPRCGLPMALGFIVTTSGATPKEMPLGDLERTEVNF